MNYLVETKTEYTIQLTNILVPIIYEGITSIYEDAMKIANQDEELKTFQIFLKKIPKWNNSLLENETKRILYISTCSELLQNLVNAVIKANIMILTNTHPSNKSSLKINTKFDFKEFIHNCYIESARIFYNNPYLFYHKHSIYDINRNQKDAKENIKNAIIEAIRKMLPLKIIINEYLGNSFKDESNVNIDINTPSEAEKHNLNILINNTKDNDFVKITENLEQKAEQKAEQKLEQKSEQKAEQKSEQNLEKELELYGKQKLVRKTEEELKYSIENRFSSFKKSDKKIKKYIDENNECESISYYKSDGKKKVEDSFSNINSNLNSNINTQQIFYNDISVQLTDEPHDLRESRPYDQQKPYDHREPHQRDPHDPLDLRDQYKQLDQRDQYKQLDQRDQHKQLDLRDQYKPNDLQVLKNITKLRKLIN